MSDRSTEDNQQTLDEQLQAAYDALGAGDEAETDVELFLPAYLEVLNQEC